MTNTRAALQSARFLIAGAVNTVVGLAVVAGSRHWFSSSEYLANAAGFAAGLTCGFLINRLWTFQDRQKTGITGPRYLLAFAASYSINLLILTAGLRLLKLPHIAAQAAALIGYSVIFFLLCRRFVFRPRSASDASPT